MRNILFISLLAFFVTPICAQETGSSQGTNYSAAPSQDIRPVRLGFLARPALTWLSAQNPELDSKGVRMGFAFGFMVDFTIAQNNNYAVATGLLMNLADGGQLNYADVRSPSSAESLQQGVTDVSHNYQWLEVPLTLKLKTNQIGYMTYFGQLGLQGGVKLSAKQNGDFQFDSGGEDTRLIEQENINDDTQLFNAGMLVGLGAEYNISGNTNIVFGITYYRGFTNVLKGDVYETNDKGDVVFQNIDDGNGGTIIAPVTGSKRRAMLNNISLNVGVIF